ncbi:MULTISPECIES: sugar ABC transporter substrate-binding protein [unclassified Aeromicrobium]|jgi:ABC-type sugar transport system substrate-binding protein|uniref:sugar ABC transporter substrate-binding protein n=1 Tax=unclassified Aeromicrobium TaxID=2633570 RepID=UPI000B0675AC|nr:MULTISPECIES: sugar ABC transporter substrate-binding protein [unclassified Aeromicrobium]
MNVRRFGLGLVATAALVVTAACGSGDTGGSGGGGGDDTYTIGIVKFASSEETSEAAIAAFREEAEAKGWKTTAVDPQGAVEKANGAMQDFVQKKVDLIVTAVFDSKTLTAGAQAAKAAGIPVVSISGGTTDGITANLDSGVAVGAPVAKQLVEDMGGKGELLVMGYKSGLPCIGREEALDDALKGTDIKVTRNEVPIPGQVEGGTQFAQAWLAKHPKGSTPLAIWGCFDDPALGAVSAAKSAGRDDVKIYGINGTPAAIKAVEAGDMRATVFLQVPEAGKKFADMVPEFIKGGVDAEPQEVELPNILVTTDSVTQFLADNPDATK